MQTLSYGYLQPEDGDLSPVWFPALAANWGKVATHDHNGTNSRPIDPAGIDKVNFTQTILAAQSGGWIDDGGGNYHKTIQVPSGITELNNYFIKFMKDTTFDLLYLGMTRLTSQTYNVYSNDNTLDLSIRYL